MGLKNRGYFIGLLVATALVSCGKQELIVDFANKNQTISTDVVKARKNQTLKINAKKESFKESSLAQKDLLDSLIKNNDLTLSIQEYNEVIQRSNTFPDPLKNIQIEVDRMIIEKSNSNENEVISAKAFAMYSQIRLVLQNRYEQFVDLYGSKEIAIKKLKDDSKEYLKDTPFTEQVEIVIDSFIEEKQGISSKSLTSVKHFESLKSIFKSTPSIQKRGGFEPGSISNSARFEDFGSIINSNPGSEVDVILGNATSSGSSSHYSKRRSINRYSFKTDYSYTLYTGVRFEFFGAEVSGGPEIKFFVKKEIFFELSRYSNQPIEVLVNNNRGYAMRRINLLDDDPIYFQCGAIHFASHDIEVDATLNFFGNGAKITAGEEITFNKYKLNERNLIESSEESEENEMTLDDIKEKCFKWYGNEREIMSIDRTTEESREKLLTVEESLNEEMKLSLSQLVFHSTLYNCTENFHCNIWFIDTLNLQISQSDREKLEKGLDTNIDIIGGSLLSLDRVQTSTPVCVRNDQLDPVGQTCEMQGIEKANCLYTHEDGQKIKAFGALPCAEGFTCTPTFESRWWWTKFDHYPTLTEAKCYKIEKSEKESTEYIEVDLY